MLRYVRLGDLFYCLFAHLFANRPMYYLFMYTLLIIYPPFVYLYTYSCIVSYLCYLFNMFSVIQKYNLPCLLT